MKTVQILHLSSTRCNATFMLIIEELKSLSMQTGTTALRRRA
jgi:hypothetical protein